MLRVWVPVKGATEQVRGMLEVQSRQEEQPGILSVIVGLCAKQALGVQCCGT